MKSKAVFKDALITLLAKSCSTYFKYIPIAIGKKFIFYNILGKYVNWRDIIYISKLNSGVKFYLSLYDEIQSKIFYFGIWEPNLTKYIQQSLSGGDIFIDVGANIGYFTCIASRIVGNNGKVYAIEASPGIYKLLLNNIILNKLNNVETYNKAVYNKKTSISIYKSNRENIGASTINQARAKDRNYELESSEIEAYPLHNIIRNDQLFRARIVKIDVEGAEWFVIDGIKDILHKFSDKTEWVVEISPEAIKNQGQSINELFNIFLKNGYSCFDLDNNYSIDSYINIDNELKIKPLAINFSSQKDVIFTKKNIIQ